MPTDGPFNVLSCSICSRTRWRFPPLLCLLTPRKLLRRFRLAFPFSSGYGMVTIYSASRGTMYFASRGCTYPMKRFFVEFVQGAHMILCVRFRAFAVQTICFWVA